MDMRSVRWLSLATSLAGSLGVVASVRAQGFGLNEVGTCAVARGYAVTGSPCKDPSSIYWNPAASAVQLKGWNIYGGATLINVAGGFTQDTTGRFFKGEVPLALPPHLFATYNWETVSLGIGAYVPYGLTSQWAPNFPGRFSAEKASLQTIYVQPNISWQFAKGWSIGGGPVYANSTVELIQSSDLSQVQVSGQTFTFGQLGIAPGTEFARARLKGSADGWGVNLGIYGRIGNRISLGARYLSEIKMDYNDARVTFTQVPTGLTLAANNPLGAPAGTPLDIVLKPQFSGINALTPQTVTTKITHPWQWQAGFGFDLTPLTTFSFDVASVGYSSFKDLPITFLGPAASSSRTLIEDFKNSYAYRFGLEHTTARNLALRAGYSFVQTPAPDVTVTPLLPDQNRNNFSVGVGLPLTSHVGLDLSYLYVSTPGRRGRVQERIVGTPTETATAAQLNNGWYDLHANILSGSLKLTF